jgi:septum formation protein
MGKLCLASTSPRRAALLTQAGIPFFTCNPGIREIDDSSLPPAQLAAENARRKASAAAQLHPCTIILAADTVVTIDGESLGKPPNLATAHAMLEKLGNRWHEVLTAVCIVPPNSSCEEGAGESNAADCAEFRECIEFTERSRVFLRALTLEERTAYFQKIQPLDKAGAYAAQETENSPLQALEGSRSNVIGLPVEALLPHLKSLGAV